MADLPLRGLTTVNELRSKMLAGILHVTILTIVCLLVFLGVLPLLFATFLLFSGFCERVTHFLDILLAGGSSSISKDLFRDAVNMISSGVSGDEDATKVEFRTGAATKLSRAGVEATNVEFISVEFKTGGKEA